MIQLGLISVTWRSIDWIFCIGASCAVCFIVVILWTAVFQRHCLPLKYIKSLAQACQLPFSIWPRGLQWFSINANSWIHAIGDPWFYWKNTAYCFQVHSNLICGKFSLYKITAIRLELKQIDLQKHYFIIDYTFVRRAAWRIISISLASNIKFDLDGMERSFSQISSCYLVIEIHEHGLGTIQSIYPNYKFPFIFFAAYKNGVDILAEFIRARLGSCCANEEIPEEGFNGAKWGDLDSKVEVGATTPWLSRSAKVLESAKDFEATIDDLVSPVLNIRYSDESEVLEESEWLHMKVHENNLGTEIHYEDEPRSGTWIPSRINKLDATVFMITRTH